MNNTVDNDLWISQVHGLHLTGEMDKSVRFYVNFLAFNVPKSLKLLNF